LVGERVLLRPVAAADLQGLREMVDDPEGRRSQESGECVLVVTQLVTQLIRLSAQA
jgi:hypothetical protein